MINQVVNFNGLGSKRCLTDDLAGPVSKFARRTCLLSDREPNIATTTLHQLDNESNNSQQVNGHNITQKNTSQNITDNNQMKRESSS